MKTKKVSIMTTREIEKELKDEFNFIKIKDVSNYMSFTRPVPLFDVAGNIMYINVDIIKPKDTVHVCLSSTGTEKAYLSVREMELFGILAKGLEQAS